MAGVVQLSSKNGCCSDPTKEIVRSLTTNLKVHSESIGVHCATLGKVLNEKQYEFDLALTLGVIRPYQEKIRNIRDQAVQELVTLKRESSRYCICSKKMIKVMTTAKFLEPFTLLGGVIALTTQIYNPFRDIRLIILGVGLCLVSGVISQVTHRFFKKNRNYERNLSDLERVVEIANRILSETIFIASLFGRLDQLSKAQEIPKKRHWSLLVHDAVHIPQNWVNIIIPEQFKKFVHGRMVRRNCSQALARAELTRREELQRKQGPSLSLSLESVQVGSLNLPVSIN